MKQLFASLGLACALTSLSQAATVTLSPTPSDLNDLDHHSLYTWRVDNINLSNVSITSATLTISNIANWDSNPNILYIHLLDTANNPGVASFIDDPTNSAPVTDMTDDFVNTRYHNTAGWLVANGTADTSLASPSFTTTPHTYTLTFNAAQLDALNAYIHNGNNFALGFDPDCHFFNDGICFSYVTSPIPEFNTALPVILLAAGAAGLEMRRRRRATA